jgi:diguanylate cyclase (GGDEF)-like protein/PAS domain S-box-containing protein
MNDLASSLGTNPDVYKTLLESTQAIPWKIDWATKSFAYIGPQIETLLGWSPSSWVGVQDWVERMHEEDRQRVFDFCVGQSIAGVDHEADYRALRKDGGYVWIRDVVHVVRKPDGEVDSLIGFMFDISERKKTEQELVRLQKELEELSFKDGLTGVSNRRMFDSILELEWTNARRNGQPLSLLMIDVDHFKQYNDHYGHLAGDDCLRRIAQRLSHAATRPKDFFARFGGEEFVLVLPESDVDAAALVANRCRDLVFKEQIQHATSTTGQILTISIGVGTIVPTHDDQPRNFIDEVDARLYRAKQGGRNRVVGAH